MQNKDITEAQEPYTFQQINILKALFQGHVITIRGEEYRYGIKDEPLYIETKEDGDYHVFAAQTGLFKKFLSFNGSVTNFTPENADSFKYLLITPEIGQIMDLISMMSEEERLTALANKALTSIGLEEAAKRQSQMEN